MMWFQGLSKDYPTEVVIKLVADGEAFLKSHKPGTYKNWFDARQAILAHLVNDGPDPAGYLPREAEIADQILVFLGYGEPQLKRGLGPPPISLVNMGRYLRPSKLMREPYHKK